MLRKPRTGLFPRWSHCSRTKLPWPFVREHGNTWTKTQIWPPAVCPRLTMIRPVRFGSVRFQASRFRFFRFRLILVNTRFRVLNTFLKNQKSPFPRRSLEIRISRVLLKVFRWSPWGILAISRNRDIRISSDRLGKGLFWFFRNVFKARNLVFTAIVLQLQRKMAWD